MKRNLRLRVVLLRNNTPAPSDRRRLLALVHELGQRGGDGGTYQDGDIFDVLIIANREFGRWLRVIDPVTRHGGIVLFDATDNIFIAGISNGNPICSAVSAIRRRASQLFGRLPTRADEKEFFKFVDGVITGSTEQAAAFLAQYPEKPVLALVDPVDLMEYRGQKHHAPQQPATVVWEGTCNNVPYLSVCASPLRRLIAEGVIRLKVITDTKRSQPWRGMLDNGDVLRALGFDDFHLEPWRIETFAAQLLSGDIAIAPLPLDDHFAASKPSNKILGYAALGLPVVASPTDAYVATLSESKFGLLAPNEQAWLNHIRSLALNCALRQDMGAAGRTYVSTRFSPSSFFDAVMEFAASVGSHR